MSRRPWRRLSLAATGATTTPDFGTGHQAAIRPGAGRRGARVGAHRGGRGRPLRRADTGRASAGDAESARAALNWRSAPFDSPAGPRRDREPFGCALRWTVGRPPAFGGRGSADHPGGTGAPARGGAFPAGPSLRRARSRRAGPGHGGIAVRADGRPTSIHRRNSAGYGDAAPDAAFAGRRCRQREDRGGVRGGGAGGVVWRADPADGADRDPGRTARTDAGAARRHVSGCVSGC